MHHCFLTSYLETQNVSHMFPPVTRPGGYLALVMERKLHLNLYQESQALKRSNTEGLKLPVLWCSSHTAGAGPGNWTLLSTLISDAPTPQTPCRHLKITAVKMKTTEEKCYLNMLGHSAHLPTWILLALYTLQKDNGSWECKHCSVVGGCQVTATALPEAFRGSYSAKVLWWGEVCLGHASFHLVHPSPVVYFVTCTLRSQLNLTPEGRMLLPLSEFFRLWTGLSLFSRKQLNRSH